MTEISVYIYMKRVYNKGDKREWNHLITEIKWNSIEVEAEEFRWLCIKIQQMTVQEDEFFFFLLFFFIVIFKSYNCGGVFCKPFGINSVTESSTHNMYL